MNAREIVKKYLKDNGYDGLFERDQPCGCGVDDLFICNSQEGECVPAYKRIDCKGCPVREENGCPDSEFNEGCFSPKWRKK